MGIPLWLQARTYDLVVVSDGGLTAVRSCVLQLVGDRKGRSYVVSFRPSERRNRSRGPARGGRRRVAVAATLGFLLTGQLVELRAELGPRHQVRGRGEGKRPARRRPRRSAPEQRWPQPGDLIQLSHLRRERDDPSSMVVSRAAVCSLSRSMFFAESLDPAAHRLRSTASGRRARAPDGPAPDTDDVNGVSQDGDGGSRSASTVMMLASCPWAGRLLQGARESRGGRAVCGATPGGVTTHSDPASRTRRALPGSLDSRPARW
jgi:hypothetical protein